MCLKLSFPALKKGKCISSRPARSLQLLYCLPNLRTLRALGFITVFPIENLTISHDYSLISTLNPNNCGAMPLVIGRDSPFDQSCVKYGANPIGVNPSYSDKIIEAHQLQSTNCTDVAKQIFQEASLRPKVGVSFPSGDKKTTRLIPLRFVSVTLPEAVEFNG